MSITVKTVNEAWNTINRIFPTDYEYSVTSSARAGYPVYESTRADVDAWISDLGCTLEANLPNGETVRVNIVPEVEVNADSTEEQMTEAAEHIAEDITIRTDAGDEAREATAEEAAIIKAVALGALLSARWVRKPEALQTIIDTAEFTLNQLMKTTLPRFDSDGREQECNGYLTIYAPLKKITAKWAEG